MELEGSVCGDEIDFGMMCFCGQVAPLCTSRSNPNPGRRFFGCSNYKNEEYCTFFCWYDPPPNPKMKRGSTTAMKIWKTREVGKASEEGESSSIHLKKSEELYGQGNEMHMKIAAMEVEIEKLKVVNRVNRVNRPMQESQNMATSMWKVLLYVFGAWLVYFLYTSLGKDSQLSLP